jgi:hypothetical protein
VRHAEFTGLAVKPTRYVISYLRMRRSTKHVGDFCEPFGDANESVMGFVYPTSLVTADTILDEVPRTD